MRSNPRLRRQRPPRLPGALIAALLSIACSWNRSSGGSPVSSQGALAPAGRCDPASGSCARRPFSAARLDLAAVRGLAVGAGGSAYLTGILLQPAHDFDAFELVAAGGADVFVARYDPDRARALWARSFGNEAMQQPTGLAVTADGTVAVVGSFSGTIAADSVNLANASPAPRDFLLGIRGSDGALRWGHAFDEGEGGALLAVGANPRWNRIAVCGYSTRAATDLVPDASFGGGSRDAVLAVFDSSGRRLWSRQMGGPHEEECTAVTIDDDGDVYAAGRYDGRLSVADAPLPDPGSPSRRWIWVAKFDGRTGDVLVQAGFGGGAGNHWPHAIAAGPSGQVFLCGSMTNSLSFGGASQPLTSAGSADAFIARLDSRSSPPFAAAWAARLGGVGTDEARDLAVDASGNVAVTGSFELATTGAAALTPASGGTSHAFLISLDGVTGATRSVSALGEPASQNGARVAFGRLPGGGGSEILAFAGEFGGRLDLGSAGSLEATGGAAFLVFAR